MGVILVLAEGFLAYTIKLGNGAAISKFIKIQLLCLIWEVVMLLNVVVSCVFFSSKTRTLKET